MNSLKIIALMSLCISTATCAMQGYKDPYDGCYNGDDANCKDYDEKGNLTWIAKSYVYGAAGEVDYREVEEHCRQKRDAKKRENEKK